MNITFIDEHVAFAPQINPEILKQLSEYGFEQIVCNRPDGESTDQQSWSLIKQAAQSFNINFVYAPVTSGQFSDETIEASADAILSNKKTVMYCLSGTRSAILWAIVKTKQGEPIDNILQQLDEIGFNLYHMKDFLLSYQNVLT